MTSFFKNLFINIPKASAGATLQTTFPSVQHTVGFQTALNLFDNTGDSTEFVVKIFGHVVNDSAPFDAPVLLFDETVSVGPVTKPDGTTYTDNGASVAFQDPWGKWDKISILVVPDGTDVYCEGAVRYFTKHYQI